MSTRIWSNYPRPLIPKSSTVSLTTDFSHTFDKQSVKPISGICTIALAEALIRVVHDTPQVDLPCLRFHL